MTRKSFQVVWAEAATRDLEEIITYIALDSKAHARKVLEKVERKAKSLRSFPERGRVVPEFRDFELKTWRELVAPPYRIIYRIAERKVLVSAVLDGRRDTQDTLFGRLVR